MTPYTTIRVTCIASGYNYCTECKMNPNSFIHLFMSCCCSLASTLPSLPWLQRCEYTQYMKLVYSSSASAHWAGTSRFYLKPILGFTLLVNYVLLSMWSLVYLYFLEYYFLPICILFDNSPFASCVLVTVQAAAGQRKPPQRWAGGDCLWCLCSLGWPGLSHSQLWHSWAESSEQRNITGPQQSSGGS